MFLEDSVGYLYNPPSTSFTLPMPRTLNDAEMTETSTETEVKATENVINNTFKPDIRSINKNKGGNDEETQLGYSYEKPKLQLTERSTEN